jgi:N-acetylated-alpha-linked acidic dipeptidase
MDYKLRTIWDVVARIDGNEEKGRWVILGNHRDAWVFGAVDPNSGTSAMLEVGRGFGQLLKAGWKPRRTIILCSWDAEEYGLVGSTEWAEEMATELKEKAIAYLNLDAAVSGAHFGASSVPSLWKLMRAVTRDVKDPKTGKSVYQQWQDRAREDRSEEEKVTSGEARIAALGSGSDYTPFLQHLGIASTDMGFGGDYGVYHSAYDSFYWMDHFGDPGFRYHVAAAQVWGTLAMRLADADGLSFDYTDYASQVREFFSEALKLARLRNLAGSLDDKSMTAAIDDFARAAERIEKNRQDAIRSSDRAKLARINDALVQAERQFIDERGLRGRAWYKHEIYAPGFYTGYAAQPLTDFRQALDDRNAVNAKEGLERIIEAIRRATKVLKQ